MGNGIDPDSALPTVVRQRIEAHHRKAHGARASRPEGGVAAEGGKRMKETAYGTVRGRHDRLT